ncbi:PREDICTED: LOC110752168 [Prunus dulcis]|uniref:PREDICTED: LOC110752168 n=1 Tax=Prunus dulcis TaxID=3755 RepID=A0A5E4G4M9_PRUDU|nr:PREDICTED: LOC110752168 [Prunus dulcis]
MAFYFKFFYNLVDLTRAQFRVCLNWPFPLYLAHNLSHIPDGQTENDLNKIWGSFLVSRDLHCGLTKGGAGVYFPKNVARQFSLI